MIIFIVHKHLYGYTNHYLHCYGYCFKCQLRLSGFHSHAGCQLCSLSKLVCTACGYELDGQPSRINLFWNSGCTGIATPLAAVAGTVLAASFLPVADFNPMLKWLLALIAGGGAATTIQAGTGILRLASSKTTAGLGNSVVATGENALAISGTLMSFVVPVVAGILFLLLIFWIVRLFFGRKSSYNE
jgi:Domain of unknown function (DUF4126)